MLPDVSRSRDQMTMTRSGWSIGNGRTSTLSTTLKTAVLAPRAIASVHAAAAASAGPRRRRRMLWRRSSSMVRPYAASAVIHRDAPLVGEQPCGVDASGLPRRQTVR
jgi:hypothetical protein